MEKYDEIIRKFKESLSKIPSEELEELVEEIDSVEVGKNDILLEDFLKMIDNGEIQ